MSKRKKLLFVVVALMLTLLIAMALGYTYAKYINSRDVSSSASVAAWSFNGAISNTNSETTTTISLANPTNSGSNVNGKLAPGTSGSFRIIVNAAGSEVDVDYDVLLKGTENNKPSNLYFTCSDLENAVDGEGNLIKYYSLADMLAVDNTTGRSNMSGTITASQNSTPRVITVNWEWPYESTRDGMTQTELDAQDTLDSDINNYTFTLSIVGKQAR